MTDTKFTPGPWDCHPSAFMADGDDKRAYFIVSGLGFSGKADANAKLISAAPDMYDALAKFKTYVEIEDGVDEDSDDGFFAIVKAKQQAIDAMFKALARARGEKGE